MNGPEERTDCEDPPISPCLFPNCLPFSFSTMDTAIRKATRLEYQPPKRKHLDTLVAFMHQNPENIDNIMHILAKRMRESSWIIVFKVLIIIHTLIREGPGDTAINYVYRHLDALDTSKLRDKSSTHAQVQNIRIYQEYLTHRSEAYSRLKVDLIKAQTGQQKEGRLRHLPVAKGLLRETQVLQDQIDSILSTTLHIDGVDGSICVYAYRLIIEDLLACFQTLNEGVVNILEHYFEMSKVDAKVSLEIYKHFAKETDKTVNYLNQAKRIQSDMQISIPNLKHAPLTLVSALEEYLNDPNYESQREELTKNANGSYNQQQDSSPKPVASNIVNVQQPQQQQIHQPPFTIPVAQTKQPEINDFFESIENERATIFHSANGVVSFIAPQPTGQQLFPSTTAMNNSIMSPLRTTNTGNTGNPFRASNLPSQMNDSALSPQNTELIFQQQQQLNRSASMMLPRANTGATAASNPFRTLQQSQMTGASGWSLPQQQSQPMFTQMTGSSQQPFVFSSSPLVQNPQPTGTNPFMSNGNATRTPSTTITTADASWSAPSAF
ncbi:ANTH domain-containing protein [Dichotomocladium elegans]|nr:ANTH domain-containing protein [Dichotomocladium elegans]